MKAFIPVIRFRHALWPTDKAVWDAAYPGVWELMARTFAGEQVFENHPFAHMIVNVPPLREPKESEPGCSGTMDISPGRARVRFLFAWCAPIDLAPPHDPGVRRRVHDWFNTHEGFACGVLHDRHREVFGVGGNVLEVVEAPDFGTLMARTAALEDALRREDAEGRARFAREVPGARVPPPFCR